MHQTWQPLKDRQTWPTATNQKPKGHFFIYLTPKPPLDFF